MKKLMYCTAFFLSIAAIFPSHAMPSMPGWLTKIYDWLPDNWEDAKRPDKAYFRGLLKAGTEGACQGISNEQLAATFRAVFGQFVEQLPELTTEALYAWSQEPDNMRKFNVFLRSLNNLPPEFRHLMLNVEQRLERFGQRLGRGVGRGVFTEMNNQLPRTAKIALATFATALACRLLFRKYENYLFTPKFITRDARISLVSKITRKLRNRLFGKRKKRLHPMIFSDIMRKRLDTLADSTREIHKRIKKGHKDIYYQNLFFYGAPGTGKSMYAEQLAQMAGMQYIVVSGSSFSMLNLVDALAAMDDLFGSANGLCIIIDEAHKLFSSTARTSEDDEKIINHFQMHTGTPNNQFTVIMTANHKAMNEAIASRIDEFVEFKKPDVDIRFDVLKLYRNRMFFSKKNSALLKESAEEFLADIFLKKIAEQTEGFAPRELNKLMNSIKAASLKEGEVTVEIVDNAVQQMKEKYQTLHIDSRLTEAFV